MNLARLIKPITLNSKLGPDSTLHPHHPIVPPRHMTTHGRSYFADLDPQPCPDIHLDTKPPEHPQPKREPEPSPLKQNASVQQQKLVQEHPSIDRHQLRPSAAPVIANIKATAGKEEAVCIKQPDAEVIVVDPHSLFQECESDKIQSDSSGEGSREGQKQNKNTCGCPCSLSTFMASAKQQLNSLALRVASLQRKNQALSQKEQQTEEHISNTLNQITSHDKKVILGNEPAILKEQVQKPLRDRTQLYHNTVQTSLCTGTAQIPIRATPPKANPPSADTPSNSKVETLLKRLQLRIEKS